MNSGFVDPQAALQSSADADLVQKKLAVDALKKRLGDGRTSEQKLREACEGFESIFLQKMWEQMRKNVKKEGYLHSKDEEAYQSMFDVELAKKMTSAGGIGLADMLQEQLSQRLGSASRSTTPGGLRTPLSIPSAPEAKAAEVAAQKQAMTQADLYSQVGESTPQEAEDPAKTVLDQALAELADERDPVASQGFVFPPPLTVAQAFAAPVAVPAPGEIGQAAPAPAGAEAAAEERRVFAPTPMPQRVSAPGKARPMSRKSASTRRTASARGYQAQPAPGATPQQGIPAGPQPLNASGGTDGPMTGVGQSNPGQNNVGQVAPGQANPGHGGPIPAGAARLDVNV